MEKEKYTMKWVLESWFCAESVFLKRGIRAVPNKPGTYQFMTQSGQHALRKVLVALDRLANAGIMSQVEVEEYKRRICQTLIDEYAAQTPPDDGMMYRFAPKKSSWDELLLEIVPVDNP